MASLSCPVILCSAMKRPFFSRSWSFELREWRNKPCHYPPHSYKHCESKLCLSQSLLFRLDFALASNLSSWNPLWSQQNRAFITLSLAKPASSWYEVKHWAQVWLRCDLQAVVAASPPADAELCSRDRHPTRWDETRSDSRFTPRVLRHRLAVKFLIYPQLKCASTHPQLGWNISFLLLISEFHRVNLTSESWAKVESRRGRTRAPKSLFIMFTSATAHMHVLTWQNQESSSFLKSKWV